MPYEIIADVQKFIKDNPNTVLCFDNIGMSVKRYFNHLPYVRAYCLKYTYEQLKEPEKCFKNFDDLFEKKQLELEDIELRRNLHERS